jgi:anti-anti-sigma factor
LVADTGPAAAVEIPTSVSHRARNVSLVQARITENGSVGVVHLEGEMDQAHLPATSAEVLRLLDRGVARLVFDMGGLTFVDSMGAAYLLMTCKRARARGGDVVLARIPPMVRKTFDVLGMLDVFRDFPSVEAAVAHSSSSSR